MKLINHIRRILEIPLGDVESGIKVSPWFCSTRLIRTIQDFLQKLKKETLIRFLICLTKVWITGDDEDREQLKGFFGSSLHIVSYFGCPLFFILNKEETKLTCLLKPKAGEERFPKNELDVLFTIDEIHIREIFEAFVNEFRVRGKVVVTPDGESFLVER